MFSIAPSFAGDVSDVVRVGITDNKFQNVLRQDVILYATADSTICDKQTRRMLMNVPADTSIIVKNTLAGLEITVGEQKGTLRDFVLISPAIWRRTDQMLLKFPIVDATI